MNTEHCNTILKRGPSKSDHSKSDNDQKFEQMAQQIAALTEIVQRQAKQISNLQNDVLGLQDEIDNCKKY